MRIQNATNKDFVLLLGHEHSEVPDASMVIKSKDVEEIPEGFDFVSINFK